MSQRRQLAPGGIAKPKLLTVEDAKALDVARMTDLFKAHINPGQLHFMKLLGFHKVKIERAEGMFYVDQNGRKILDFFGGFGSLAFGHNHPRILEARRRFQEEKRHEIAIAFMSQYAAALAYNIAACSPGELDMVFLGSSGSEAMEAAIKVAERAAGPKRPKIVYAENSFHGKTKGVLSVTDGSLYRGDFKLVDNTVRVPFGDIAAVENAFRSDPDDRRDRARNRAGRRRHRAGAARILAEAAQAVRPVWRHLGRRRSAVRLWPHRALLRIRALRRHPRCDRAGQVAGRRQGRGRRHDRQPQRLHESLRHAEDGDDPCAGDVRRHRRGLHHGDRRRSTCSTTRG